MLYTYFNIDPIIVIDIFTPVVSVLMSAILNMIIRVVQIVIGYIGIISIEPLVGTQA